MITKLGCLKVYKYALIFLLWIFLTVARVKAYSPLSSPSLSWLQNNTRTVERLSQRWEKAVHFSTPTQAKHAPSEPYSSILLLGLQFNDQCLSYSPVRHSNNEAYWWDVPTRNFWISLQTHRSAKHRNMFSSPWNLNHGSFWLPKPHQFIF